MITLSNQDEFYLFNTQKPIAGLRNKDHQQKDFREIVLGAKEEDDKQDLWLKLLDLDSALVKKDKNDKNWINLYLGRSKTFEKGQSPQKHNLIVPLIPRCYATADRDPAQAVEVPAGWLYIIRQFESPQGRVVELWRELKSDGLGNFSDVNLKRFKGLDHRKATGQSGFRVIVPYCINKQDHQLWMAYSEVQWSWNRVQSMKQDAKLREQRMHKLDLSDSLNDFAGSNFTSVVDTLDPLIKKLGPLSGFAQTHLQIAKPLIDKAAFKLGQALSNEPNSEDSAGVNEDQAEKAIEENTALLYNLKSAPDPESRDLPASFKDAIPVVYLDNPIGIGRSLARAYQQHWEELTDCVSTLRAIPDYLKPKQDQPEHIRKSDSIDPEIMTMMAGPERFFEAAALANRYFYSKISKVIPPGVKDIPAYEKRLNEIDAQFLEYQNKLDRPAIEQALRTAQRRAIREKLVQSRERLVSFLQTELAMFEQEPGKKKDPKDPPLIHALDDYFTLTPLGDREQKQNPNHVIGDKSTPRWRDNYLDGWGAVFDLVAYLGKHEYSIDADLEAKPGDGWDWRRKNPAFELLRKLADPEGGCPLHDRLFPKPVASDPLKVDAAKVEDTTTAFKPQYLADLESLTRRDADLARGLNLFGSNFNELMAMRDDKDPAYEKRLERARHSILRLIESAFSLEFQETEKSLAELVAEAEEQREGEKNDKKIAKDAFLKLAGFLQKTIDTADKDPSFARPLREELRNIRVRVIRTADTRRIRRLLHDLSDDKFVSSGLGGFFGLVEIHNFNEALKAFSSNKNPDRDWELFAPLAASFLKIPAAIKDAKDAAAAAAKVAERAARGGTTKAIQGGTRNLYKTRALQKTVGQEIAGIAIKKLNLIGDLIDMGVTLSSFTENLAQNDDAAIADAIGFTGATLGLIGMAFGIPVLGWVAGLVGIAAWLAKVYLFKEDTPVEIWINNGPFARGNEYHEHFKYARFTTIKNVRDSKGQWGEKACTVYSYDTFEFLVDSEGTLVHAGGQPKDRNLQPYNMSLFKVTPDGTVRLRANEDYGTTADTPVATVGQPFTMHQLLEPTQKTTPQALTVKQPKTGVDYPYKMRKLPPSLLLNTAQSYAKDTTFWPYPHDAYLALADAAYRPRVAMTQPPSRPVRCVVKVSLPFYLPGKSELYIDFEEKAGSKSIDPIFPNPDNIKDLRVGAGEYEISREIAMGETRDFTAKVRLDLFGDHEMELPHEPLFCGADIETEIDESTVKGVQDNTKWIVANKRIYHDIPH